MPSTSEVGHAKNLANIDKVIDLATQFGVPYNPINPQITLAGLATLKTNCTTAATNLDNAKVTYKNDTNTREIAFKPIDKLVTSISDAVKTLNVPQQTIDDVVAIVKKIHGDVVALKTSITAKTKIADTKTINVVIATTTADTPTQLADTVTKNKNTATLTADIGTKSADIATSFVKIVKLNVST